MSSATECKYLVKFLRLSITINLRKMKEDNVSQLDDYRAHSVYNNTRKGLVISLCLNSNHLISLIPPQTASNFRHLLSCDTIGIAKISLKNLDSFLSNLEKT